MTKRRDYPDGQVVPGTIYQVIKIVGSGGMGTVYEVEDTTIGKLYVLKTLHSELGDRRDLARRMQSEARALARLHHPNIVEVVTAGVTNDDLRLPYYVMERLTGQNLRGVLDKRKCLDVPHACHIAIDLLDALDHAHDKGVIHRDVKPENVFLHHTPSGVTVTKLLDFGVMTLLDGGTNRDTEGHFVGTFRYAAPEQLRGEKPSTQMDLYAAALILFEMIAGRGPFDEEPTDKQVAEARLNRVAPPLSVIAQQGVVPELDALVRAALRRDPEGRPRDAFSFAAQLRNLKRLFSPVAPLDIFESTANAGDLAASEDAVSAPVRPAVIVPHPNGAPPASFFAQPPSFANSPAPPGVGTTSPMMSAPLLPSSPHGSAPQSGVKTTALGMAPPTVGAMTLENAPSALSPSAPARSAGGPPPQAAAAFAGINRQAVTHSLLIDTPRGPRHGTEPMSAVGFPNGDGMPTPWSAPRSDAPGTRPSNLVSPPPSASPARIPAPAPAPAPAPIAAPRSPAKRSAVAVILIALFGLGAMVTGLYFVVRAVTTAPPPKPMPGNDEAFTAKAFEVPAPTLRLPALDLPPFEESSPPAATHAATPSASAALAPAPTPTPTRTAKAGIAPLPPPNKATTTPRQPPPPGTGVGPGF